MLLLIYNNVNKKEHCYVWHGETTAAPPGCDAGTLMH
jgi:hypothetical protein